jgi:hypothetical protein
MVACGSTTIQTLLQTNVFSSAWHWEELFGALYHEVDPCSATLLSDGADASHDVLLA